MCVQVVQVWLLSSQCGCVRTLRHQSREVEKLKEEDVDEMILETDVDGDSAVQNESESDALTDRHGVHRRRLHRDSGGGIAQDQDSCKVHGGW